MLQRGATAQDENVARQAGKAGDAGVATRPTRTRAALGDVTNVAAQRAAAPKPGSRAAAAPAPAAEPTLAEMGIHDIDMADAHDPHCVTDYVQDIYKHFRATETTKAAKWGYMSHQTDINEKMRSILIDWLFEVHQKFKLMPETLYLTVNLIDRFLEKKLVMRQKLQLVGVTAMLLASKYEEIYAPEVRDFVYITDKAYTREQILAMEAHMLNTLDFRITVPTAFVFLNRGLKAAEADTKLQLLATFIVERCLQEYRMLAHAPSKVAAAGLNIAMRTLQGADAWNATMAHYGGYSQEALRGTIRDCEQILDAGLNSSLQAVRKKYMQPRFLEVANTSIAPLE